LETLTKAEVHRNRRLGGSGGGGSPAMKGGQTREKACGGRQKKKKKKKGGGRERFTSRGKGGFPCRKAGDKGGNPKGGGGVLGKRGGQNYHIIGKTAQNCPMKNLMNRGERCLGGEDSIHAKKTWFNSRQGGREIFEGGGERKGKAFWF